MTLERKRRYLSTLFSVLAVLAAAMVINLFMESKQINRTIKVGFIYVGDSSDAYTNNFLKAQMAVENEYGAQTELIAKYNVSEDGVEEVLKELVEEKCDMIFATSYGYGEKTKEYASKYPDIEFCQATCSNANEEPVLDNYHTYMGAIYQGRYIAGVAGGMKLKELIDRNVITPEQAKIGYIAAYPYAEVISGYTAFFLGVRSVVPEAVMTVRYTNSWGSYKLEKEYAKEMIENGCVLISQHSDTAGPAVACEETDRTQVVYYVSYNDSMQDVAPTTYLTGSKINWTPYMLGAVKAVLEDKDIEDCVEGNVNGNDIGAGFENDWVKMLPINELSAAEGTRECIDELIEEFKKGEIKVFKGDYIGVNPYDSSDTIDLRDGYNENEKSSAPTFSYILKDVITVE